MKRTFVKRFLNFSAACRELDKERMSISVYAWITRRSFTLLSDWKHNQLVPASQFISHRDEALGKPGQHGVGQQPWQARSSQANKSLPFSKKQQSIRSPLVFQPIWVNFINNSFAWKVQNIEEVIYSSVKESRPATAEESDVVTSILGIHV